MIQIHVASLVIGLLVGFLMAAVLFVFADKALFYDERYWAGWGNGFDKGYKAERLNKHGNNDDSGQS